MRSPEMGGYTPDSDNSREALRDLISNPEKLDVFKNPDGTMKLGLKSSLDVWKNKLTNSPEDKILIEEVDTLINEGFNSFSDDNTKIQEGNFNPQEYTKWAKQRALEILQRGDLKQAIDSMISDLVKDPTLSPGQAEMITTMGMILRNDPILDEKKVREFIEGFAE